MQGHKKADREKEDRRKTHDGIGHIGIMPIGNEKQEIPCLCCNQTSVVHMAKDI